MTGEADYRARRPVPVLLRQDFIGGLTIMAVAAFAFWQGASLPIGTLGGMGPGMLPKGLAVLLGALGALLAADAVLEGSPRVERWTLRGPIFVLASVVAFGVAVRPLGLVIAGPLTIIISGFASNEVRWGETLIFGLIMTVICVGLFKFALGLPIPLAPWLIGY